MFALMQRKTSSVHLLVHQSDDANLVRTVGVIGSPEQYLPNYLGSLGSGEELFSVLQNVPVIETQ